MVKAKENNTNIKVAVQTTGNKSVSATAQPTVVNSSVETTNNLAKYYADLSKEYAISDDIVQGNDRSSKYYAKESANSAYNAKNYADASQETYQNVQQIANTALTDIEDARVNAVDNITTVKSESITDINNTVNDGVDNISTLKNDSLQEIETKADDIIADIQENGRALPMFTPTWSDHILNDASYLRADTFSWQNADIYITGYEILENEYYNENCVTEIDNGIEYRLSPNGFKIADASQNEAILDLYESGNEAWFYIIDTENRKFKLPREKSNEHKYLYFYVGNYSRPDAEINLGILAELANSQDLESVLASINEVKDTGIAELEATTASGVASITNKTNTGLNEINAISNTSKQDIETLANNGVNSVNSATTAGVKTINDTISAGKAEIQGVVATGIPTATLETSGIVKPDGETITITEDGVISSIGIKELPVASADVLGCVKVDGETITIANGVISAAGGGGDYSVVEVYGNSASGYRLWSDGYCEQWGNISVSKAGLSTVTFLKPYKDTNYIIASRCKNAGYIGSSYSGSYAVMTATESLLIVDATAASFKCNSNFTGQISMGLDNIGYWQAFGYVS